MYDPRVKISDKGGDEHLVQWNSENVGWAKEAIENGQALKKSPFFDNNPRLKKGEIVFVYSDEEILEFSQCMDDIIYFVEKYCKLRTTTEEGTEIRNIKPFPYQRKQLLAFQDAILKKDYDRFIMLWSRQASKTTTTAMFMVWCLCFRVDFQIAILANKGATSKEVLDKVKDIFTELPFFLQPGVFYYNTSTIALDNGNKISCFPTTKDALNGRSINFLYIDEFAFTFDGDNNQQKEFLSQAMPVLNATRGIMAISSTPNGRDLFSEMYDKALRKENSFFPTTVKWYDVPGKTEEWAKKERADIGKEKFDVQYELQFDVECNRILNAETMKRLATYSHKFETSAFDLEPLDNKHFRFNGETNINFQNDFYIFSIDLAEGLGLEGDTDFTTIHGLELTHSINKKGIVEIFLKDNIIFECNTMGLADFSNLTADLVHLFEEDHVKLLIEYNTYGELFLEYLDKIEDEDKIVENESFLKFKRKIDSTKKIRGLRTNSAIKKIGVKSFIKLMEKSSIEVTDIDTIDQIKLFNKSKKGTYEASSGHDDLVTPLVNLAFALSLKDVTLTEFIEDYLDFHDVDYEDWQFSVDMSKIRNEYR